MSLICPTVTATDIEAFNNQLNLVESFAKRIHLDFMDAELAPTISPPLSDIKLSGQAIYDLHLMYQNPTEYSDELLRLKPNMVIVHAESNGDLPLFATKMRESGIRIGLAILPGTKIESVKYLLPHMQHALIFGGHLGYHGGQADLNQLTKAAEIRAYNRHLELAWDGGANNDNVVDIKQAGIDVINVGSAIHKAPNPKDMYKELQSLVD